MLDSKSDQISIVITTPEKQLSETHAQMVTTPTVDGDISILPGHCSLLSLLGTGELTVTVDGQKNKYFISQGYLEVDNNEVIILSETGERAEDIDLERAQQAKSRALDLLRTPTKDINLLRATLALQRAESRISIYSTFNR